MYSFSKIVNSLRTSEIRDLMSLATKAEIISFAGGMPNDDLFPVKEINDIFNHLPEHIKKTAFQYGPTPGYPPLLESVKEYMRKKGLPVDKNKILITTGSLQAINILAKIFIDPGDVVITENPAFIGAISAFKSYMADIQTVEMDSHGIIIDELRKKLSDKKIHPKFLYITPFFHNPAGTFYSVERRKELIALLQNFDIPLIEDDAYGELYFEKEDKGLMTPIKAMAPDDLTICYTSSFSKILGPGMRLGWMLVPPHIYEKCELVKQSMDACSPNFTQVLAHEFLSQGKMQEYVAGLRPIYKKRKNIMIDALKKYMPEHPAIKWVEPRGGFYIWISLPEYMDANDVLKESIAKGTVFVVGRTFDPTAKQNNHIRLSFSNTPEESIEKGVMIIANSIKKFIH